MLFVLAFAMRPKEGWWGALWVLGETGKELRSIQHFILSVVTASQITRDLETFLQTEFWRLIRKHGCKTFVVTV